MYFWSPQAALLDSPSYPSLSPCLSALHSCCLVCSSEFHSKNWCWWRSCKGNCGLRKCSKCCAHSRALKCTSRGSKDVQLCNNELEYITYLAGDPKRKEWGLPCWHSLIYEPTYKVQSNVNQINVDWIYIEHKQEENETVGLIGGVRKNRKKIEEEQKEEGVGPEVWRLWRWFEGFEHHATSCNVTGQYRTNEVSRVQRFEDFEGGSKASKTS